jgi:predicted enzyme related to lactoylglutathione lyase
MAGKTEIKFWPGSGDNLPKHTGVITDTMGFRYFTFLVDDVAATAAVFKARGAQIVLQPTDFGKIARIMMIADPDGNWIEFAARKPAR